MIYYIRDEEGSLIGFKYNNNTYYYLKNIEEDIIGITDSNNNKLCSYEYDSWGKIISIKDNNNEEITGTSHIAYINPFRYRSYYYDEETKLYYLNSRYYNPEWGRFINADKYVCTDQGMQSINMYQYTENNPINRTDSPGNLWFMVARAVLGGIVSGGIQIVSNLINGEKAMSGFLGAFTSGAFAGAISATPLNFNNTGSMLMSFGASGVENMVNFASGETTFSEAITNTLISGTISKKLNGVYDIGETWIRPEKLSTSIVGNYQKKMVANDIVNGVSGAAINKQTNKVKETIKQQKEKKQKRAVKELKGIGKDFLNLSFTMRR